MKSKQIIMGEVTPEYQAFTDKFKPKLTTDDCYTPDNIYDVVRSWVFDHYDLPEDTPVVRPFWPGGDYQAEEYPDGCVVIDNPPFSILSEIETYYLDAGIRFFLFAPGNCLFKPYDRLKYIIADTTILYHNGAKVNTSFVTNMGEYLIETAPDLTEAVKAVNKINLRAEKKELPKYTYPMEIVTAARCKWYAAHGTYFRVRPEEAVFVRTMDNMAGKNIFGSGFIVGPRAAAERAAAERAAAERAAAERAAAERAAAERAAAYVWELSSREREISNRLR